MATPIDPREESEEPDPEFIIKLSAFHAERGSVSSLSSAFNLVSDELSEQHTSGPSTPSQRKADQFAQTS